MSRTPDTINALFADSIDTLYCMVQPADAGKVDLIPYIDQTFHHGGYDMTLFVPVVPGVN